MMTEPANVDDVRRGRYEIRTMGRSDVDMAIAWAAAEGWNPGLHDADSFYPTDPDGFLMGWLEGEAIASLSAVRYGNSFGFIGFYIVRPEYRGQGYGLRLWQAGMDYLRGRTIGLDGVVDQQENYKKSGFRLAYRNIRYEGIGAIYEAIAPPNLSALPGAEVVELTEVTPMLLECDRPFFPDDRTEFLRRWLTQSESYGVGLMQQGRLMGYGVVRPCQMSPGQTGYKIGPLFADTVEGAEVLFLELRQHMQRQAQQKKQHRQTDEGTEPYRFYLDVPEPNGAAVELARRYDMTPMFETARMYAGQAPDLPVERIFGVTTFELG